MGLKDTIEFQTQKMITAYGGVGSIIESMEGALIVEIIERWTYVNKKQHEDPRNQIEDERLLRRLRYHFPKLKALVKIPVNVRHRQSTSKTTNLAYKDALVSAKYFPEWMYCRRCDHFKHIRDWWKGWKDTLHKEFSNEEIREKFTPPKCFKCYAKGQNSGQKRYYDLEQVRFIMTSPSGDICDFPWDKWNTAFTEAKEENASSRQISLGERCCENQQLKYQTSKKFADLTGVRIECASCGKMNTLEGIWGVRDPSKNGGHFKTVIRTSNSVCYSQTLNGIYLPVKSNEISSNDKTKIKFYKENRFDIDQIHIALQGKYSKEQITNCLAESDKKSIVYQTEAEFRRSEYDFLLECNTFRHEKNYLSFEHVPSDDSQELFKNLIKVKKLKVITVQTSYTRQEPLDKDACLQEEESPKIKRKYTSEKGRNTEYLTAIESFGEGIFLNLDGKKVDEWYEKHWRDNKFSERIKSIQQNYKKREFNTNPERFTNSRFSAKFILAHTLAHLLIKELEFLVGYSAASLHERLYVDEDNMQGILIYAVAGSEGSYGGLISQCTTKKIIQIIKSALMRAEDCASDPVCYNSDGQGIANTNLAACYSCTLLPETSCEEFNSYLDRGLLIDDKFGYFKTMI